MPSGLQTWDPNGVPTLQITDSLAKIIGSVTTVAGVAGEVTAPDFQGGTRAFIVKYADIPYGPQAGLRSEFTISGRTISWTAGRSAVTFFYGVY